ncbi:MULTISPECIES: peptide MFS transporter [Nitrosomonas]|uniref:POT family proton-dependent oligopeptide transporter n=1 Tax=Nitrosomonas communis TaxID=44574 RepID=A0A0F7KCN4_9PROT|nr:MULTISPECIES: peptide MFS transporter [Nitrosomonas]AKH36918.1 peptide ABC transporter [Nitrosomonas communis]TYP86647.1 POT family proton-dependent oligopeptide transporter [Nitrosomonas communis]UVS62037.1 peptide MFS transporter [Nitrosomonas sp. PLL12]
MSPVKHPKGLYLLFFTEMWERFSYYGMRAIFTLFMIKALFFDKALASEIYGNYTGLVYLTPLVGGYVADRYWGNRRTILVGGVLMGMGHFCMFLSASNYSNIAFAQPMLFLGLGLLILGNGFFKPNISTMVGQLYQAGDKRIDAAFTIFYMGINLGAFFAPLVCGGFGDTGNPADFKWGFLAACIGMIISILSFELLKNKLIITPTGEGIGLVPKNKVLAENEAKVPKIPLSQSVSWAMASIGLFIVFYSLMELDVIGSAIFSLTIIGPAAIIADKTLTSIEKQRIGVIYILAFFVIFFWAAFEQAGASLTFFAEEQTDRNLFGAEIPASFFQSINAVFIIILAPVFAFIWTFLGQRNLEPSSPTKQAFGLLFLSIGYLVIACGVQGVDPAIKVSFMWLTSLYLLHTIGELCLSPIGLAMVVKLAPEKFAALLMGVWFLSTAAANKFAGTLSSLYPDPAFPVPPKFIIFEINDLYEFFMIFVILSGLASLLLFILTKTLQKMMHGVQ